MSNYIKNLIVEQNQQNKILLALSIFFRDLYNLDITNNIICNDRQHQNHAIDRIITLEDGSTIYVDDKNQLSVQLNRKPVGKQSDKIYLEYKRRYDSNKTSYGIFSNYKKNDLLAILTGDNYCVIFDMQLLEAVWEDISEDLIQKYGYDDNDIAYTEYQEVDKRGEFDGYAFTGYYLRLSLQDLSEELLLSHTFAVVDLDNQQVIL